ncbi:hypothetical protein PV326_004119 [Microctonus aethiopoides]|nr:hypothetical protein PV326_004119 [Microctonus aethiopoides]
MESVDTSTMHVTETKIICPTLPGACNGGGEISKKLEEELLYGVTEEDGDEDDAQSDDSLRLRLSDDDVDAEDNGASLPIDNQLDQSESTKPLDMEFDNDASNICSMEHQDYSNGICSIESKYSSFQKKLDLIDDHFLPETNFCATSDKNSSETGTNKFLALNTVNKYTCKNREKSTGSFETYSSQTNRSISVNESDHSYYSIISNRYCNKYYNQNSHFGRCRGYKFGEFNTYFNSLELERNHCPRVCPPSRKVLPEQKHMTEEFNSQTNVSAIKNASLKDNSSPVNNNIQNDIKPTIADNNTHQLIESKSPTDKLNVSLNQPDTSSPSHDIQNEPKENGIIDKDNETTLITNEVTDSINAQNDDTNEKVVDKPNAEEFNVPITGDKVDDNVSEKSIEKNVEDEQLNEVNSINETIKDAHSSVSDTMLNTVDNLPKSDIIVKTELPFQDDQDDAVNTENEQMLVDNDNPKGYSEKELDDVNKIDKEQDDSNVENHTTSANIQHDDEKVNKSVIKRPRSESDDENSVSKKMPPQDSVMNEPSLVNNEEVKQASTTPVPSTTEMDSNLKAIVVEDKTVKQKPIIDSENSNNINVKLESVEEKSVLSIDILDEDDEHLNQEDEKLEITAVIPSTDLSTSSKCRRRKRKINSPSDVNSGQEKENVRQRRETAQKAEEIIRKRFLHNESDSDSSDNVRSYVKNKLPNTSLKRASTNTPSENSVKKPKKDAIEITALETNEMIKSTKNHKTLEQVRKFFWKDEKKSLSKFTQEELEEILIQKVIETITMRDEIGKLREQAKISERNQEATRLKCQQLSKQIKDFEMVLTRFSADRRTGDKNIPPIKINRSVGLQVNFLTDHGVQNLRQLQQNLKSNPTVVNGGNSSNKQSVEATNSVSNGRKGIKVRSPRRPSDAPPVSPTVSTASTQIHLPITSTPVTPPTLVVSKTTDNHPIINPATHVVSQQGTITLNGALTTTARNQPKILNTRSNNKTENLIDLTGEEEKTKHVILPPLTAISTASNSAAVPKTPPRYQRVIQPAPSNITIAQSAIKLVQSGDKPMPAALVNNMNAPRLAFVMHGVMGQPQLLIPSKTNPIRPAVTTNNMSNNRASYPITYTGVQAISNGAVRVVPTTTTVSVQKLRHPAPLPGVTNYPVNAALKLPPPAPALKISRVANGTGIVLSWNMKISNEYAEIASYQLYAYQEIAGVPPTTSMWKKVGDVRALPLPMACTLTQFSEGNNYYFAVRAVDTHSRFGQYSQPGNISL